MPLPIEQLIKGTLSQGIAQVLFEQAGFRVARLGIEELFREVKSLDAATYGRLGLPDRLRHIPDFLIAKRDLQKAWVVEVKYRQNIGAFRKGFDRDVREARKHWPEAFILIMVGESPNGPNAEFIQDYVRVIPPDKDLNFIFGARAPKDDNKLWDQLHRLTGAFEGFIRADGVAMDKAVSSIRILASI